MVASVGSSLQSGNVNPFQKQVDDQNRNNIGKSGQEDKNAQEAKRNSGAAPAVAAKKSETDQQEKSFLKASQENDNENTSRKTRGGNLDITV